MQYIGDAKYGALKGTDQSVSRLSSVAPRRASSDHFCIRLGSETDTLRTSTLRTRYPVSQAMRFRFSVPVLTFSLILCRPPPVGRLCPGMETLLHAATPDMVGSVHLTLSLSMNTTPPKFPQNGTLGYNTSGRILPPKTPSCKTFRRHGNLYAETFRLSPGTNLTGIRFV